MLPARPDAALPAPLARLPAPHDPDASSPAARLEQAPARTSQEGGRRAPPAQTRSARAGCGRGRGRRRRRCRQPAPRGRSQAGPPPAQSPLRRFREGSPAVHAAGQQGVRARAAAGSANPASARAARPPRAPAPGTPTAPAPARAHGRVGWQRAACPRVGCWKAASLLTAVRRERRYPRQQAVCSAPRPPQPPRTPNRRRSLV